MPTIFRFGPYRFFFYSSEGSEPVHVHVERDDKVAKFWVQPVRLAEDGGFKPSEIKEIARIVSQHQSAIIKHWHEHFED